MADIIKSDIEKIERALNIRVDDVEIEVALNAAFPKGTTTHLSEEQINEQTDLSTNYHCFTEDFNSDCNRNDHSSVFTLAKALNLCYQRNLFQLSNYCQSIDISSTSKQSNNRILPVQIFEIDTSYTSNITTSNNESIQNIRRMMQREQKARLTSKEVIEKLIENVVKSIRQNKNDELVRRIDILRTSKRPADIVSQEIEANKKLLDELSSLSDRELIRQEHAKNSIDWTNIAEILMNNQYTAKCCQHAWQQICLPVINYNENWSPEDDQLLYNAVEMYGAHANQWQSIAHHFPQRSPFMCASRYMSLENNRMSKLKFSKDQVNELKQAIEENRYRHYIPLNKIAYKLNCGLSTVMREWRKNDPSIRRGPWQVDEDEALIRNILKQANRETINWNLVACNIPGRSQNKCYHRYIHLTRKTIKTEFEPHDDQLLIEQHHLQNARWSEIQRSFPGRSCYTLQNRWRRLTYYRQVNELFNQQPLNVQLFILKQYPTKEPYISLSDHLYHRPNFQLTYDQLQCLTSNGLFIEFCNRIDLSHTINHSGIRQFLKKLSTFTSVEDIEEYLIVSKRIGQK